MGVEVIHTCVFKGQNLEPTLIFYSCPYTFYVDQCISVVVVIVIVVVVVVAVVVVVVDVLI